MMVPTARVIANAINEAIGIRFNELPLPAKIFRALQEQKAGTE
jgi:CO/xanthine dehydrogenase Mo-binding subunit